MLLFITIVFLLGQWSGTSSYLVAVSPISGVAELFELRTEFGSAWPLEDWIQCDLHNHNLCKNRLL